MDLSRPPVPELNPGPGAMRTSFDPLDYSLSFV